VRPAAGLASDTGSATFDFVTVETGRYPSSVIVTEGAPVTRLAERLVVTNPAAFAADGFFRAELTLAPSYASDEPDRDHDLLHFDADHRVFLRAADRAVVLFAAGAEVLATQGLSWKREQELTIGVTYTPSVVEILVRGADGGDVLVSDTPAQVAPIPVGARVHLLGSDAGSQECADLRGITFFAIKP
jgi:hypothetical protein